MSVLIGILLTLYFLSSAVVLGAISDYPRHILKPFAVGSIFENGIKIKHLFLVIFLPQILIAYVAVAIAYGVIGLLSLFQASGNMLDKTIYNPKERDKY